MAFAIEVAFGKPLKEAAEVLELIDVGQLLSADDDGICGARLIFLVVLDEA